MCGINGFNWQDRKLLAQMNHCTSHRGPDNTGNYSDPFVSLGQNRLAIIDLDHRSDQPFFYTHQKRTAAIVFNGEIYNFHEIKTELEKLGYKFKTTSDTEVILASYLEWGPDCVTKFNGMWAFAIYDKEKKLLFCSRDRFGKKPFYYYNKNGKFIFSSELKGIVAHNLKINTPENINTVAVGFYFALGFIPAPHTIYTDVYKLEARTNLIFDLKKKKILKQYAYYDLPPYNPVHDRKALVAEGKALVKDAVRLRLIADVPVGAFLSGGLDSSTVVGEMANFTDLEKLHTFSIGFEGKYDETPYINVVKDAFGTKHHHQYFKQHDFDELLRQFPEMYDEPYGDFSGFPTYAVSKLARQHVTVALSGDGGDEVFGGYPWHVTGRRLDLIRAVPKPLRSLGSKLPAKRKLSGHASYYLLREAFKLSLLPPEQFYSEALTDDVYTAPAVKQWMEQKLKECLERANGDLAEALRIYDVLYHTIPDHFLVKVDRASMANALEIRAPFLDYRLVEYAQRIPREWKLDSFNTKKLMREIIKDVVPESIVNRGKQGFSPPIDQWLKQQQYQQAIREGLPVLEFLDKNLYFFYKHTVMQHEERLYNLYRIRLFLFMLWWKRWVQ